MATLQEKVLEGERFYANKDYVNAKKCFDAVLAVEPNHPTARTKLNLIGSQVSRITADGKKRLEAKDYTEARARFNEALAIEPGNRNAQAGLKINEDLVQVEQFLLDKRYDDARTSLERLIRQNPSLQITKTKLAELNALGTQAVSAQIPVAIDDPFADDDAFSGQDPFPVKTPQPVKLPSNGIAPTTPITREQMLTAARIIGTGGWKAAVVVKDTIVRGFSKPTVIEEEVNIEPESPTMPDRTHSKEAIFTGRAAANTEATRLLASGAITQGSGYRKAIIKHFSQPYQAVAPELGIDSDLVLRVCKFIENQERQLWMYYLLILVPTVILLIAPAKITEFVYSRSYSGEFSSFDSLLLQVLPFTGVVIAIPTFILSAAVVTFWSRNRLRRSFANDFKAGQFKPDAIRARFKAPLLSAEKQALPDQDQNLLVYSGFDPYVGAGTFLEGWSLPIDLDPFYDPSTKTNIAPKPFEISDLYKTVEKDLENLNLGTFSLRDYLYTYGGNAQRLTQIVPTPLHRPKQVISPEALTEYMNSSDHNIRLYKWVCLCDWEGELATSFFLRFSKRGHNLFIEFNIYVLHPIQKRFHIIDEDRNSLIWMILTALFTGWWQAIRSWFGTVRRFVGDVIDFFIGWQSQRALKAEIIANSRYDYGTATSIRQHYSEDKYTHFFQRMDVELYTKIVQDEVFESILSFLEEHQVDTTEFRRQTANIINNGTMVMGNIEGNSGSISVGQGSSASVVQRGFDMARGAVSAITG